MRDDGPEPRYREPKPKPKLAPAPMPHAVFVMFRANVPGSPVTEHLAGPFLAVSMLSGQDSPLGVPALFGIDLVSRKLVPVAEFGADLLWYVLDASVVPPRRSGSVGFGAVTFI